MKRNNTARSSAGQAVARRGEQAIFIGDQANQQEPGNENERCPVLGGRRPRCRGVQRNRDHESGDADAGEAPTKQALTVAASFRGHRAVIFRLRIDHSPKLRDGRGQPKPANWAFGDADGPASPSATATHVALVASSLPVRDLTLSL